MDAVFPVILEGFSFPDRREFDVLGRSADGEYDEDYDLIARY